MAVIYFKSLVSSIVTFYTFLFKEYVIWTESFQFHSRLKLQSAGRNRNYKLRISKFFVHEYWERFPASIRTIRTFRTPWRLGNFLSYVKYGWIYSEHEGWLEITSIKPINNEVLHLINNISLNLILGHGSSYFRKQI